MAEAPNAAWRHGKASMEPHESRWVLVDQPYLMGFSLKGFVWICTNVCYEFERRSLLPPKQTHTHQLRDLQGRGGNRASSEWHHCWCAWIFLGGISMFWLCQWHNISSFGQQGLRWVSPNLGKFEACHCKRCWKWWCCSTFFSDQHRGIKILWGKPYTNVFEISGRSTNGYVRSLELVKYCTSHLDICLGHVVLTVFIFLGVPMDLETPKFEIETFPSYFLFDMLCVGYGLVKRYFKAQVLQGFLGHGMDILLQAR